MRRLPVFFILDVSESMVGENLHKLEQGMASIVSALRTYPHALDTVHLSVIAFAGIAKTLAPLADVATFTPPRLPIGSGTALGAALDCLMDEIDRSVVRAGPQGKGDWQPVAYLFTDGKPTDRVDAAVARWRSHYGHKVDLVAVAIGRYADLSTLRRLTENTVVFEESQEGDFDKFIRWITASVTAHSRSLGDPRSSGVTLAKLDDSILSLAKDTPEPENTLADRDCVALVGRCQHSRKPYLIKYDRVSQRIELESFALDASRYEIAGGYPVEEDYFEWSGQPASGLTVNTADLVGGAECPHCGNPITVAMCACGQLMCLRGPGEATCPWCEKRLRFEGSGDAEFEVRRGRG
jgi:uncharacterized protein YegL